MVALQASVGSSILPFSTMKKTCSRCRLEKFLSDFTKDVSASDGRYHTCKVCKRELARDRYSAVELDVRREKDRLRSLSNRELIAQFKAGGCSVCAEQCIPCIDLHHRDPSTKLFSISNGQNVSTSRLIAELEKCAVLCANCHRKVHAGLMTL